MQTIMAVANEEGNSIDHFFVAKGETLKEASENLHKYLQDIWYLYRFEVTDEDVSARIRYLSFIGDISEPFGNDNVAEISERTSTDIESQDPVDVQTLADIYNGSDIEALYYMSQYLDGEIEKLCERVISLNENTTIGWGNDDYSPEEFDEYCEGKWKLLDHFGVINDKGDAVTQIVIDGWLIYKRGDYWYVDDEVLTKFTFNTCEEATEFAKSIKKETKK